MKAISKMVLVAVGAVFLTGCGGGGGSSSGGTAATGGGGGGSGGGGQATALAMAARVAPQPTFTPAPQGTEESGAQMQRDADNSFEPVAMSPIKRYTAETQTLRVGSLISGNERAVISSQVEGLIMAFSVYNENERRIYRAERTVTRCGVSGDCPQFIRDGSRDADGNRDDWDRLHDRRQDLLAAREARGRRLYDRDTGIYTANRDEYESAYRDAAQAVGEGDRYAGPFIHSIVGFSHYRISSNANEIHTDALGSVHPVITGPADRQVLWDVALFGKRDPTAEDRLDHMDFGVWAVNHDSDTTPEDDDDLRLVGGLAFGVETPAAVIPTTGTATYNGLAVGLVGPREGPAGAGLRGVSGDVSVVADFATNAVTATFSEMHSSAAADAATPASIDWHNFEFAGTLNAGDRAQYTANTITVANPAATIAAGVDLLDNLATGQSVPTGSLQGRFYGPAPVDDTTRSETGGRWTVGDTDTIAVGSFGAKRQ